MRMKFIGENSSMCLEHGTDYNIEVKSSEILSDSNMIIAYIKLGKRIISCPYSSFTTFFQNWRMI